MSCRIVWIDIIKAFAILSVIVGHMISCEAFYSFVGETVYSNFIMAFHMPLFTVLSGWFFSVKHSAVDFIKTKSLGILLPYIVWCFVWFFVKPIIMLIITGDGLHLSSVVWQLKFYLNDGLLCYGWWFLRGLFFSLLLAYGSVKIAVHCGTHIAKHAYAWGGWLSCLVLYVLCFADIIPNQTEKDSLLKGFIYMYPFLWAGFGLRQLCDRCPSIIFKQGSGVLCWITFIIGLVIWDGSTDTFYAMNTSIVPNEGAGGIVGWMVVYKTVFRFVVGVIGSLSFILLFKYLFGKESSNKVMALCQTIGQETLGIYILQSLVYWSLPKYDILGLGEVGNFGFALFISFLIILAAYYIIKVTSKNRWLGLFLWGKRFNR